ncbi:hypothetical protein GDO81_015239 [Engystomops pustulosus]|uniref:Uncharacterized protein n=1 Tax=Engystomops pustulosus TaxID=76066 RepID=A0AAV7AIQ0_ENGPU|nr:hypothetical protein GDO81_015239 [Engystomops pustulosus]
MKYIWEVMQLQDKQSCSMTVDHTEVVTNARSGDVDQCIVKMDHKVTSNVHLLISLVYDAILIMHGLSETLYGRVREREHTTMNFS